MQTKIVEDRNHAENTAKRMNARYGTAKALDEAFAAACDCSLVGNRNWWRQVYDYITILARIDYVHVHTLKLSELDLPESVKEQIKTRK